MTIKIKINQSKMNTYPTKNMSCYCILQPLRTLLESGGATANLTSPKQMKGVFSFFLKINKFIEL